MNNFKSKSFIHRFPMLGSATAGLNPELPLSSLSQLSEPFNYPIDRICIDLCEYL